MGDDEGGSFYGKLGVKLGAGAAKMGKRAAQSEAGRNATKSAIRGASDSIRDDMMSRFDDPGTPTSPTSPTPSGTSSRKESTASRKDSTTSSRKTSTDSQLVKNTMPSWLDEPSPSSSHSKPPPPKPSFLDKFKSSKQPERKRSRNQPVKRTNKNRVYKQRLAKEPDWDRLPMAQALYHFKGEMKCDLQFRKGQMVLVMTRTDSQNDWWEGKVEDRVGIFPANYVKMVKE